MMMATATVAELVSQMQANLDAINFHLARISDTKAHDDEIDRLELEREKRAELLTQQWEKEAHALEEKKRQAALPAVEQRRRDYEKAVARRAQEEQQIAAARKREDEEIAARRQREDDDRLAKRQQHDHELKVQAEQEEEEIKMLFAAEEEMRRADAIERENTLYDDFETQMEQLEEAMEQKVEESQRTLADLEGKRQAISAMIDAKMRAPRPASFRRGSKRFSASPSAADVAAMLAGGRAPMTRKSTLSSIHEPEAKDISHQRDMSRELPVQSHSATLDALTKPLCSTTKHNHLPTWADQASLAIVRGSHGVLSFRGNEADMTIVKSPEVRQPTMSTEAKRAPIHGRVQRHTQLPTWADQSKLDTVRGVWGALSFNQHGADLEAVQPIRPRATSRAVPPEKVWFAAPRTTRRSISSQGMPQGTTRRGSISPQQVPNGLGSATMNHGAEKSFVPKIVAASSAVVEVTGEKYDVQHPVLRELVQVTKERKLSTGSYWSADQGKLSTVTGSHGMLSFGAQGSSLYVVAKKSLRLPGHADFVVVRGSHGTLDLSRQEERLVIVRPNIYWNKQALVDIEEGRSRLEIRGNHTLLVLPRPRSQGQLEGGIIRGDYATLQFSIQGSSMKVVRPNIYWRDQATLPIIRGSHGLLHFASDSALTRVVRPDPYWTDQAMLSLVTGQHARLQFTESGSILKPVRSNPYWVNQASLAIVRGEHGKLSFNNSQAVLRAVRPDPYWIDQSSLLLVTGQHGRLQFSQSGAALRCISSDSHWKKHLNLAQPKTLPKAVSKAVSREAPPQPKSSSSKPESQNQYWIDQSTLQQIRGSHATLSFSPTGATLKGFKQPVYWVDQSTLTLVRGSHATLKFNSNTTSMLAVRPNPYWTRDQATLPIMKGTHGTLQFDSIDATMIVSRPDPYWADQSTLHLVQGSHGRLAFDEHGAEMRIVRPDPYWSADQRSLPVVRGSNGNLVFVQGRASVEIVRPDPYWIANQSTLPLVRGTNGRLDFNLNGAELSIVRPDPYWIVDQATLSKITGTHGQLKFGTRGASVQIKGPDPYWTVDQCELDIIRGSNGYLFFGFSTAKMMAVSPNRYWKANQKSLRLIQGVHGSLSFHNHEASLRAVLPPRPFWMANQATLDLIRGSHATLSFSPAGASLLPTKSTITDNVGHIGEVSLAHAISQLSPTTDTSSSLPQLSPHTYSPPPPSFTVPAPRPTSTISPTANKPTCWIDQSHLPTMQGSHGMLVFHQEGATTIPHQIDSLGFASPLETADFFADGDESDYGDFASSSSPRNSLSSPPRNSISSQRSSHSQRQKAEEKITPRPASISRRSFGPGAFAALLNRVKDNVPIVTNLVGNGSYSSLENTNEESSPITPTSEHNLASPIQTRNKEFEPLIHQSSWIDTTPTHHQREVDAHYNSFQSHHEQEHRELNKVASPLPTKTEFDPYNYQTPSPAQGLTRSVTGSWEKRRSGIPMPIRGMNGQVERKAERETGKLVGRARAVFEGQ